MSLPPASWHSIPEDTVRIARASFPKGTLAMRLRDTVDALYDDALFADLFASTGRPAEAPWRLALVTVLQFVEDFPDRQAADAVRGRLDWKYLLGLDLCDPGFDYSLLSDFRTRIGEAHAEQRLLERVLDYAQQQGLLKKRGRQRTDSTHVLAAVRSINRFVCVGETLRQALNVLAQRTPEWLRSQIQPDWFDCYSRRFEESRVPASATERAARAAVIGADGLTLLAALSHPDTPEELRCNKDHIFAAVGPITSPVVGRARACSDPRNGFK